MQPYVLHGSTDSITDSNKNNYFLHIITSNDEE